MKNPFLPSRILPMLLMTLVVVVAVRASSRSLAGGHVSKRLEPLAAGATNLKDTTIRDTAWRDTVRRDTSGRDTLPKPKRPKPLRPRRGAH